MGLFRRKTQVVEADEVYVDDSIAVEQGDVLQRLTTVEKQIEELENTVHELELAKKRFHGDD